MSTGDRPFSLVAYIRRLSAGGSVLYIRLGNSDISRLGLRHGQAIEIDLGRVRIAGIVKASGGSPWLAPGPGSSNAAITDTLRNTGFEHGMDVQATARSLNGAPASSTAVNIAPARAVAQAPVPSRGDGRLRIDTKDAGLLFDKMFEVGAFRPATHNVEFFGPCGCV